MKRAALIITALLSLAAKHPSAPLGPLDPRAWDVKYSSSGVTLKALVWQPGWSFDFPGAKGHVNYIMRPALGSMNQAQALTFTVRIEATSGAPVFNYLLQPENTCVNYASVRAHIVGKVDSGRQYDEANLAGQWRWWSNPINVELTPGTWAASTPLTPDQWSDTTGRWGTDDMEHFESVVARPFEIGLTFGGGCFFGHGVNVSIGTARFSLLDFRVIP